MTFDLRTLSLRANAAYIGCAAFAGLVFDIRGVLYGVGPQGRLLATAPHAGIGFVEAHGLALILAVLLWRAAPTRAWHLTAAAMEVLLGAANLAFWEMFVAMDALMVGYVTTALHWIFVVAQLTAAMAPVPDRAVRSTAVAASLKENRMMRIRAMFALASLVLPGSVALAQTVSHDARRGTDFSKFKTYAWTAGENLIDPLNHKRVVNAIDVQLTTKGLIQLDAAASPDVLVAYDVSFDTNLPNEKLSTALNAQSPVRQELMVGTLVVRIVDAKSKKTVWRGKITNAIDSYATAEKREASINHAAVKLFQSFLSRP